MIIFKYPLSITDRQEIEMPAGSKVIKAGLDPMGGLCVWVLVKQQDVKVMREIIIRPTGGDFEMDVYVDYIDSVVQGCAVWHVFVNKR